MTRSTSKIPPSPTRICHPGPGGGFATRELYTDGDETIFEAVAAPFATPALSPEAERRLAADAEAKQQAEDAKEARRKFDEERAEKARANMAAFRENQKREHAQLAEEQRQQAELDRRDAEKFKKDGPWWSHWGG